METRGTADPPQRTAAARIAERRTEPAGGPPPVGEPSFDELYRERWAPMVRLGFLLTGSEAIAEEVVQDAFVSLRARWAEVANPGGYLRTTVVNRCRSALRTEGRRPVRLVRDAALDLPPEIDETWACVQRLPELQRAVVVLRFYEDLSESEIAEVLGCRPGTVKSRLHRGLARLKGALT